MTLFELTAILTLNTADFISGIGDAETKGESLAKRLGADAESIKSAFSGAFSVSIGQLMADGFKAALGSTWEFTQESVEAAAQMEGATRAASEIFGEYYDDLGIWASGSKNAFGMAEGQAMRYATQLASIFAAQEGMSTEEIYNMSTSLTKLAGDMAVFFGYDVNTAFEKIKSGIRGETEAIEDMGVDVRAATLAAFAGMSEGDFGKLETAERYRIEYDAIMAQSAKAQGFFAENQDTYSAQMAIFDANIKALQVTLGSSLLPTLTSLLKLMNNLFAGEQSVTDGIDAVKDSYESEVTSIETTVTKAESLINKLEELSAASKEAGSSETWKAIYDELNETIPGIGELIGNETLTIESGAKALREYTNEYKALALETAKQRAVQRYYDEYANMQLELAELTQAQAVSDTISSGATEQAEAYIQKLTDAVMQQMIANGVDEDVVKNRSAWISGNIAANLRETPQNGYGIFNQSPWDDTIKTGLGDSFNLLQYLNAAGYTTDSLVAIGHLYQAQSKIANENDVDYSSKIAELQNAINQQELEIQALTSIYDTFFETDSTGSEPTNGTGTEEDTEGELSGALRDLITAANQLTTAAESLSGAQVTLDGDTLIGYVSAGISRNTRNNRYTGTASA